MSASPSKIVVFSKDMSTSMQDVEEKGAEPLYVQLNRKLAKLLRVLALEHPDGLLYHNVFNQRVQPFSESVRFADFDPSTLDVFPQGMTALYEAMRALMFKAVQCKTKHPSANVEALLITDGVNSERFDGMTELQEWIATARGLGVVIRVLGCSEDAFENQGVFSTAQFYSMTAPAEVSLCGAHQPDVGSFDDLVEQMSQST